MNDERLMILQMLKDGKITPEEANGLLDALNKTEMAQQQAQQHRTQGPVRPTFPPGTNINNLGVQIGRMIRDEIGRAVGDPEHAGRAAREVMRSVKDLAHEIKSEVNEAIREAKEQERAQRKGGPAAPARPATPARPAAPAHPATPARPGTPARARRTQDSLEELMDDLRDQMREVDEMKGEIEAVWRELNQEGTDRRNELGSVRSLFTELYALASNTTKMAGDLANLAASASESDRKIAQELIHWANEAVDRAMTRGKEIESLVDEMATLEKMDQSRNLDDLNGKSGF